MLSNFSTSHRKIYRAEQRQKCAPSHLQPGNLFTTLQSLNITHVLWQSCDVNGRFLLFSAVWFLLYEQQFDVLAALVMKKIKQTKSRHKRLGGQLLSTLNSESYICEVREVFFPLRLHWWEFYQAHCEGHSGCFLFHVDIKLQSVH